jgi:hypothetical protein
VKQSEGECRSWSHPVRSIDQARAATLRCALFIDFDNVYIGLRALDADAAEAFATDPAGWLNRLELGVEASGLAFQRRFLLRSCYLNPSVFARYRPFFTRAGFRVIDCPSLTRMGKIGADINLVLDAVDALGSDTRYDEFVILSGDADFTPLALRLREADRRVTLVTASPAASAYRSVADTVVDGDALAELVSNAASVGGSRSQVTNPPAESAARSPQSSTPTVPARAAGNSGPSRAESRSRGKGAVAAAAVGELLHSAGQPLRSAAVAQCALRSCPDLASTAWDSYGSCAHWLVAMVPHAGYSNVSGGYVWDATRFSEADVPGSPRGDDSPLTTLQRQVVSVTDTPALTTSQYQGLLTYLAKDLQDHPFTRTETSKRVRDACEGLGGGVGRNAINFVISGLLYSGVVLDSQVTAQSLGASWAANVAGLCRAARMELDPESLEQLLAWVGGGLGESSESPGSGSIA